MIACTSGNNVLGGAWALTVPTTAAAAVTSANPIPPTIATVERFMVLFLFLLVPVASTASVLG
jgi:hypothetical protein